MSDPFNDYCYLFNYLSMRKWAEARADCVNQGGDLVSVTDPFEQAFIQGMTSTASPHCSNSFFSCICTVFVYLFIYSVQQCLCLAQKIKKL